MNSDLSDVMSDEGSDISEPRSEGEDDVAYNDDDDDEEYVEPPEYKSSEIKSGQRMKSKAKPRSYNVSGNNRTRKREQDQASFVDEEDVIRPKRRHVIAATISADDEELEADEMSLDEELDDDVEGERDDNIGTGVSKAQSEELEVETPEEDIAGTDTMPEDGDKEDTTELLKPTRSKMLLNLLGDGSSRKSLTEEESQLRRAENARKRKNLSEKRSEEEKQETINKLLRRRAGKSRSHIPNDDEDVGNDAAPFSKPRRPYNSFGHSRTIRQYNTDLYCAVEPSNDG
ncbi:hypothetical protein HG535_0G01030 [Zygotorulaspora mrakii]|uniref:INO80 complex subunit B-like conserved region domain-containing protein n=1 Tax=Zygotorulaspora mrakii TaxID=42260 RepID=A0A7H9B8B0_ZYGMR|nr:uncharacterized protein HG535_0G01030 [Zygotorulaspora mrakii]QLG74219.1 hypothetical protein HG535_0G01030 [Zygotorulaspora mrakii]